MDLRARVVDAIGAGMSRRAAALRFGISAATAVRWAQLQRDRGSVASEGPLPTRRIPLRCLKLGSATVSRHLSPPP